jgi:hypothetical protein
MLQRIAERADEARAAPAERRAQLRQEAEKLRDRWSSFEGDVRKAAQGNALFLPRAPARDFTAPLDRFPIDRSAAEEVGAALRKSAEEADPDRALAGIQSRLDALRADWERLSVESKRDLLRYEIIVGALRGCLAGGSPDQVASQLRATGAEYKNLGGKADEQRFGSKVLQVFQALTK